MLSSPATPEPLHRHGRLRTADAELAREIVADVFEPHNLRLIAGEQLDARLNAVQMGGLTLGYLAYGADTRVTLPPSEQWYHVNINVAGRSRVARDDGGHGRTTAMEGAAVLLPHHTQTIDWDSDTAQFALRVCRSDLEGHLSRLANRRVDSPVDFDLLVDLRSTAGQGMLRCIDFIRREWDEDGVLTRNGESRRQLESMLLTTLLMAATGPHRALLDDPVDTPKPGALQRAVDHIHSHARELPTLAELTEIAGVGARTLQNQFMRHLGCTPSEYLRDVRLRAAREELLNPESPATTVTTVAMAWGFYNLGRFAAMYKDRYHEGPSETLRRSKA